MKNIIEYNRLIDKNAPELGGVFSTADLANILNTSEKTLLPQRISQLEDAGIVKRFIRGIYIHPPTFNPSTLSRKLCTESYLSLDTVLADRMVIGTIPKFRLTAVKIGRSRLYQTDAFAVEHLGLQEDLFFGFSSQDGINVADAEKALLDCLYFYQKGRSPTFNIYVDLDYNRLDKNKIADYLCRYKNPKFVTFVQSLLKGT